jgi:zinc protease
VESIEALTLEDVGAAFAGIYRPEQARIFIAGDLETKEVKRLLESAFGSWAAPATASALTSASYPQPANDKLRVVIVDKPGAVQTVVRFVMPGSTYADPNRNGLLSLNTILGGSFTSRLNRNLREEKGYTYGARSAFRMAPSCGSFEAYASVRADVTGPAIAEFLKEFAAIRASDISADEAVKARSTRRSRLIQSLEGLNGLLNSAIELSVNDRPFTDLARDLAAIDEVDAGAMNRLAHDAVPLERGLLVLVGDEKLIREHLGEVELPAAVSLTVSGEEAH